MRLFTNRGARRAGRGLRSLIGVPRGADHEPVRQLLENQREHLLAFAVGLDRDLEALARQWQIGGATARAVLEMQALPESDPRRWRREAALRATLRGR